MTDLYVYYKVRSQDAAALAPRVRALQADLRARLGVAGQLKRRPEERDGLQTWMEVYPSTTGGFADQLAAAVDTAGLADTIAGPRHAEVFIDLPLTDEPREPAPCA